MYLDCYGLKEEPFKITPDPKYFYTSRQHLEVLSSLQYAVEYRRGFGILIGEAGSGKTTVAHVLLKKLDPGTKTAVITNTHLDERELIYTVLRELGEEVELEEKCVLLAKLNDFLIEELSRGGNPVLLIDEAQNLSPKVLEEVRMLANLETESEKLIQIIMIGQPGLEKMLRGEDLTQLQQRFSIGVRLSRLDLQETREYIHFRTETAGANGNSLFTEDAVDLIYEETRGIPRVINNVCDACLINAYALGKKHVDGDVARETVEERRQLSTPDSKGELVFMDEGEKTTRQSSSTGSDGKRHRRFRVRGSDLSGARTCDPERVKNRTAFVSNSSSRGTDLRKPMGREEAREDDEPAMWLKNAFGNLDAGDLMKSRGNAEGRKLRIAPMPAGHDIIKDLLMEYRPERVKRSARHGVHKLGTFNRRSIEKGRAARRSCSRVGGKMRIRRSASACFGGDLAAVAAERGTRSDCSLEALFGDDEKSVLISGEEL